MASDDLCWLPALELASLIRAKKVSPVEVTEAVLARIERLNPALNAFCTVTTDEARDAAQAAEVSVMTGEELGPLHGVPVSAKDLVFTRRVLTTGGSRLFAEHVPEEDAVCVERLQGRRCRSHRQDLDAGVRTQGRHRQSALRHHPQSVEPVVDPRGLERRRGAAVAAGLGPLAVGTDAGGSIRIPASFCGIYGLKPSFGRVPQAPGFPDGRRSPSPAR